MLRRFPLRLVYYGYFQGDEGLSPGLEETDAVRRRKHKISRTTVNTRTGLKYDPISGDRKYAKQAFFDISMPNYNWTGEGREVPPPSSFITCSQREVT